MNRLAASSLAISVLGLLSAAPAVATPIAYGTGLANPATTIDFSGTAIGADLSTAYAAQGVTFSGLFSSNVVGPLASSVPPAAANYAGATVNPTFTISFATAVTDAAFFLYTDGFGATVTSSLKGAQVETTSVGQYGQNGHDYFGFSGSTFDTITIAMTANVAGDQSAEIDNLQFNTAATQPVPEPGSSAILGAGLTGLMLLRGRRRV